MKRNLYQIRKVITREVNVPIIVLILSFLLWTWFWNAISRVRGNDRDLSAKPVSNSSTQMTNLSCINNTAISPPKPTVQYQTCTLKQTIHITGPLETVQYLRFTNSSIVRFGDADVRLMMGKDTTYQNSSTQIIDSFHTIIQSNLSNLIIGFDDLFSNCPPYKGSGVRMFSVHPEWRNHLLKYLDPSKQYFASTFTQAYVQSVSNYCFNVPLIYLNLREIWRDRDLVILRGNHNQTYIFDVYDTAKSQVILFAPRAQAFSEYAKLKQELFQYDASKLFILAAGPVSKTLGYDLALSGRRALDLGHLAKDYDVYMRNASTDNFYVD